MNQHSPIVRAHIRNLKIVRTNAGFREVGDTATHQISEATRQRSLC